MNRPLSAAMALAIVPAAHADIAHFGFEDDAEGPTTALTVTDNGLAMSVRRANARQLQVLDSGDYPASWGRHAIAPFGAATGDAFILSFSLPVTRVTFEIGDFAADSDLTAARAFAGENATGGVVDEGTYYYAEAMSLPEDVYVFELIAGAGESIRSVWFDSMDLQSNMSMILDNVTVTFVPAPGAAMSFLALATLRRRR